MTNKNLPPGPRSLDSDIRKRIERTIGGIGGTSRRKTKILNVVFLAAVFTAFGASLLTTGVSQIASIDIGLVLLSLKVAYHLHTEAKVNHAQFWILTTLEDRLLDVIKELRGLRREFRDSAPAHTNNPQTKTPPNLPPDSPRED